MLTAQWWSTRGTRTAIAVAVVLTAALCGGFLTAPWVASAALAPKPNLSLARVISANPFTGSSVSAKDNEGMAYVPKDGSIWIADDDGRSLHEISASSGALKRTIGASALAATPALNGGGTAGSARTADLESLAYDETNDVLYAFSGSCCSVGVLPTAFRLRRVSGKLQLNAYQPLPGSDFTAAGWNPADRKVYVGVNSVFHSYDFASNSTGAPFQVSGISGILGMDFTNDGKDLFVATSSTTVTRVSWSSRSTVSGWAMNLSSFGLLDTRAVEIVGDQMFVSDGSDTRPIGDPRAHAVFVFNGIGSGDSTPSKPTASFEATPTSGVAPLTVAFRDTSAGSPTQWRWTFGDGSSSSSQNPTYVYEDAGRYTARLTVSNSAGSSSASRTITVSTGSSPTPTPSPSPPPPVTPSPPPVPDEEPPSTNLLRNGGFEHGLRGWSTAGRPGLELVQVTGAHSGDYAGRVRTTGAAAHVLALRDTRSFATGKQDHVYGAVLWVRSRSNLRLVLHVREKHDGDVLQDARSVVATTKRWQQVEVSLTPRAPGRSTLRVLVTARPTRHPSAVTVDDVALSVS
jgi:PKD repeat protein